MTSSSRTAEPAPPDAARPPLVLGLVLAGSADAVREQALDGARAALRDHLARALPEFEWQLPLVHRADAVATGPVEPAQLLELGALEREAYGWDFALVVTAAELRSFDKPFALGAPAKSLNVAVLSLARLVPPSRVTGASGGPERAAHRIVALALHLFGHLNDLGHSADPADFMCPPESPADLDGRERYSDEACAWLRAQVAEEADPRLEEAAGPLREHALRFYLRTVRQGAADIARTVRRTRPWRFPARLARLTTAAASTMVILVLTAEAWELGTAQPAWRVVLLSLLALVGTSAYVLQRQRVLVRRRPQRLTEQQVVANVSITLAVGLGMLTTYAALFAVTLALSLGVFPDAVAASWAQPPDGAVAIGQHLALAGFVATLGLVVGALGASFEARGWFRHVTLVDEET